MSNNAWKNGQYLPLSELNVSILDFGLIHCDATYDVLAIHNGYSPGYDRHIARFRKSCEYWRLPFNMSDDEIIAIVRKLYQENGTEDAFVWLGVTRGVPDSGRPRDLSACHSNVFMYAKPYYGFSKESKTTVWVAESVRRVPDGSIRQSAKNFAWNDLTRAQFEAADNGKSTAVLLSEQGYLTEGPGFNAAIVIDGTVLAPSTNRLQGVTMDLVEQICADNGIPFDWTSIHEDLLRNADEMFLASTAGNVIPVTELSGRGFSRVFEDSQVTDRLREIFEGALFNDRYARKISPI